MKKNPIKIIADFFRDWPNKSDGERRFWSFVFMLIFVFLVVIPIAVSSIKSEIYQSKVEFNNDKFTDLEDSSDNNTGQSSPSFGEIFSSGAKEIGRDVSVFWKKMGESASWVFAQIYNGFFWMIRSIFNIFK